MGEAPPPARRLEALHGALQRSLRGAGVALRRVDQENPVPPEACLPFEAEGGLLVRRERCPRRTRWGRTFLRGTEEVDDELLAALAPGFASEGQRWRRKVVYLDAETTGLGGGTGNYAFLVGWVVAYPTGELRLEQVLLRDEADEPAMLERLHEVLADATMLVTYNGKSFDLPLLRNRRVMNRMTPFEEPPHIDLLHVARRVHKKRHFKKSLTTLEKEVLAFDRGPDDVAGEEVAFRYLDYLRSGDARPLAGVVDHHRHDIWSLVALLGVYGSENRIEVCDWPSVARNLGRVGQPLRAAELARRAVESSGEVDALRAQGEIAKRGRQFDLALRSFEAVADRGQDDPWLRLELAKLYEHRRRDPAAALRWVERGVAGSVREVERRKARLLRKLGLSRVADLARDNHSFDDSERSG
ncbi:MAG: ribonuclease H-like domain-containing protein [Myxococcota bacterium]